MTKTAYFWYSTYPTTARLGPGKETRMNTIIPASPGVIAKIGRFRACARTQL